ncbi:uracil-DNA glycosylase [Halobacillus locisalis]|uniref:Uracil-DNA glycosylase n=1 Tax=Halobacillus locisalis TaxID=220753 RepID=A0A838CPZ2_9BACI|nr:uracil-DNA glycosylase [Halobacillus locisalis]MBA2173943.1 uracil-DNA glycosylase [Halobacillus locisalis]
MKQFENDWSSVIEPEFEKEYYHRLRDYLKQEYEKETVYPPMDEIFSALDSTSFKDTKVVIIGQDPYHGPHQAHGFSFSVRPGVKIPPSLRNIYKELETDLGIVSPNHGNLQSWASEGVLLLNNVLTVRAHQAHSHKGIGWERFTDAVIESLNQRESPVVFLLWGKHAQEKGKGIDETKHKIIATSHPSPLAAHRGFLGSRPFSKTNDFLKANGERPIDWSLPTEAE